MPVNNKIKIRRGNNIDLPAGGTESGELRYSIDTKELYIDDGSLNIKIGGDPYAFPVSTATQSALNGKQASGTYSTDIHGNITALNAVAGTNTGDETLTSIKTKLGAASAVSDGYLTSNMFNVFNNSEPSFSKNTAFNKNFGTTTGTVLEGRTFGTAANSAVGDFQPIENQRLSTTNAPTFGRLQLNTTGRNEGIAIRMTSGSAEAGLFYTEGLVDGTSNGIRVLAGTNSSDRALNIRSQAGSSLLQLDGTGAATFSSTVNSTGFLLNGNNLTSSLSTNYIPKWNGSSMANSLISDDGLDNAYYYIGTSVQGGINLKRAGGTVYGKFGIEQFGVNNDTYIGSFSNNGFGLYSAGTKRLYIRSTGEIAILSTTPSTSPTTGALVVNGGVGADHVRANNFYGNGSNLTGIQLPITLTTNGTSGAATFSGNVLNIPNYTSSGSFIQNQTTSAQAGGLWVSGIIQTNNTLYAAAVASHHVDVDEINITIAGTSGNATFIQPFRGIAYKKVIINLTGFVGNVNWSYPTAFTNTPVILMTDGLASTLITSKSTTSVTVTSATATTGILILEGY